MGTATKLVERLGDEAYFAALCIRAGMVGPELPHRLAQLVLGFERFGILGGAIVAGAIRHGDQVAMVDERGEITYSELDERVNALANAWRARGLEAGEGVAILVRNHRGFLEAVFAATKCGARIVLLNTSFAGPQIREVAGREGTDLLVYDEEYGETLEGIDVPRGTLPGMGRGRQRAGEDTLEALIEGADASAPRRSRARAADHDPHQRHDRDAEGRATLGAAVARTDRRPAQQGAVPGAGDNRAVRADVSRARLHAGDGRHRASDRRWSCAGASIQR